MPPPPPAVVLQLPLVHMPSTPPHAVLLATQIPPAQQAPAAVQLSPAQQGCPTSPQGELVPFTQAVPLPVA